MKKRRRKKSRENNLVLKTFFLLLFLLMLGLAFVATHENSQKVAGYAPHKSLQIGWFTILKKIIPPVVLPIDNAPTPTLTPCPGGIHTNTVNVIHKAFSNNKQSVAFFAQPTQNPNPNPQPTSQIIENPTVSPTPYVPPAGHPCYPTQTP